MTEARKPTDRNRRVVSGALSSDITRAVEILSAQNDVPGSMAYRLLVQLAATAGFSVREIASALVNSTARAGSAGAGEEDLAG